MYLLVSIQAADTLSHTQQAALILLEVNKFSGGRHQHLGSFSNCTTTQLYILHLQNINVTHVTFYNNSIFPCKTTHLGGNSIFAKTTAYLLLQQQPHQLLFNQYRKRSIRLVIGLGGDMGVAGRVINGRHDCMSFL